MKIFMTIMSVTLLLASACNGPVFGVPDVHVQIHNRTTKTLSETRVEFGRAFCLWGYVGSTGQAYSLYYSAPITRTAKLIWKADNVLHVETLELGEHYPGRRSGVLRFNVYDDHATVDFRREI